MKGAAHKGVQTPHVQREIRNIAPDGTVYWNKDSKWVRSINEQDLKIVENYLESVKK